MILKLLLSSAVRPLSFLLLLFSSFMVLSVAHAGTCDAALSKYYDMDIDALESLKKEKKLGLKSRSTSKLFVRKKIST